MEDFVEDTHYRARRMSRMFRVVALVLGAVLVAPAFDGSGSVAFRAGSVAAGVAFAAYGLFWLARSGMYTSADGLRLRWALGVRRFGWEEVEAFRVVRGHPLDHVVLVTVDGGAVRVPSISQGPMEWDGGETDDAAARLNAHLAWARSRQGWEIPPDPDM